MFTDSAGKTAIAGHLGDKAWRELLIRHHDAVLGELQRFRGREIDTAGDGFFAAFDGPACASLRGLQPNGAEFQAAPNNAAIRSAPPAMPITIVNRA